MRVELWQSSRGKTPVGDFILDQNKKTINKIDRNLKRLKMTNFTELIQSGFIKPMKGYADLYEQAYRYNKIWFRFFLTTYKKSFVVLHAFKKKTNYTPKKEIKKALNRQWMLNNQ